jgi:hypothetical protein
MSPTEHFWQLCDEALRLDLADDYDCRTHEPPMVALIGLVKSNPEQRSAFVRCFEQIVLGERQVPYDLVPFCMRSLRLQEIKELVEREASRHAGTAKGAREVNSWSRVLHAFDDDVWEDADMWPFYAHELKKRNS